MGVAVARSATTFLPNVELPDNNQPGEIVPAMNLVSSRGRAIAFDVGIGACDKNAQGLVKEFPDLIVVGGTVTRSDGACTLQLVPHRVDVRTKRPVGTRLVVDALHGQPLSIQPAPLKH